MDSFVVGRNLESRDHHGGRTTATNDPSGNVADAGNCNGHLCTISCHQSKTPQAGRSPDVCISPTELKLPTSTLVDSPQDAGMPKADIKLLLNADSP
ncbi:unnamed protein product [Dibothriocephalus latus]|uniref:Uncharacterized protein n=1 Tax=Dibothriocephalus latus TaxID=60516 RepID=A0A3P7LC35_DIBLA|nr:unnamed protein product [Dibothriocephalus latus]